jgi:FkbM family methyltransferase
MEIVSKLRRIPGAPKVANAALTFFADVFRWFLGPRSKHWNVTRDGIKYDLDLSEYVQIRIFFNSFDREDVAKLIAYVSEGDTVIDVGAHVGYYALNFARAVAPQGRVIAFEPDPVNVGRLRRNLALNGFTERVSVVESIATDNTSRAKLYLAPRGQSGGNSVYPAMAAADTFVECEATTIDVFCFDNGIACVRVLKIDVEGHEAAVLRGARSMLKERRIDIVMLEYRASWVTALESDPDRFDEPLKSAGYIRIDPKVIPAADNVFNLIYASPVRAGERSETAHSPEQ